MTSEEIAAHIRTAESHALRGNYKAAFEVFEAMVKAGVTDGFVFDIYRKFYAGFHGADVPHAEIFNFIYASDAWEGGSGAGSRPEATAAYRGFLKKFIAERNVRTVVDAGCGDWQSSRLIDWSGIDYLGIDVSSVALANTRKFAAPGIRFLEGDVRTVDLPSADLLIMKDVLQHWSNADISTVIPKFRNYRYALIANGATRQVADLANVDTLAGDYRPVDLALPPFSVAGSYIFAYRVPYVTRAEGPVEAHVRVFLIEREPTKQLSGRTA